ncbi:MAG: hypothetical protein IJP96_12910 [Synergistaceae bacterium]|nr:hypothetical protein [Synergistaceae bacterium]MBR0076643.1 hypothetical protein [Synergistaceae bacterium]MBR0251715.1 hypothetical protein [Synergistaceae bacterium]MBR0253969.1 hypothetical protein [Synergistaceae bacterium]
MKEAGIEIKDTSMNFLLDGNIHRFATSQDEGTERSGYYKIFFDKSPAGFFGDWRQGIKEKWHMTGNSQLNYSEWLKLKNEQEEKRKNAEKLKKEQCRKATQQALEIFKNCPVVTTRDNIPYLTIKNRSVNSLLAYQKEALKPRLYQGGLIFGLFDSSTGNFQSYQSMYLDSKGKPCKRIARGTPLKGSCYCFNSVKNVDNNDRIVLVVEGIFTGLSVWEHLNFEFQVFACMSCYNMFDVLQGLRKKYTNTTFIILADNDFEKEHNAGIYTAQLMVNRGMADSFIAPKFSESESGCSDFEDYFNLYQSWPEKIEAMKQQILTKIERGKYHE